MEDSLSKQTWHRPPVGVMEGSGQQASMHFTICPSVWGEQEQWECERLIITSGTDWDPAEEEFSTSLQAPPGQMVLLLAAAPCVWCDS